MYTVIIDIMSLGDVYDYLKKGACCPLRTPCHFLKNQGVKLDLTRLPFYRELEWLREQTSAGFVSGVAVGYLLGWMLTWKIILVVSGLLFYDLFRKRGQGAKTEIEDVD